MSKTIKKHDRTQYPGEDCRYCRFNKRKGETRGCGNAACLSDEISANAFVRGHTKQKRRRDKWQG